MNVYLLIEFQSSIDRFMAVRIMGYVALLCQDLIRQKAFGPTGRLPPVLPELNDLQDLHEVHAMLSERIKKWPECWKQEGREEVRRETAYRLIATTSLDDATIAAVTGLAEARVGELREQLRH